MRKTIMFMVLTLMFVFKAKTQENFIEIKGFVDSYHAIQTKSPQNFLSSRTRLRAEISKNIDKTSLFVSFNLNQNSLLKARNGFELREVYLDYTNKYWSFRIGRQIIIWGAADGLRISDLVSPIDLSEFLAREYDDIRMPVEAVKWQIFNASAKLELIYVPILKSSQIPTDPDNPWSVKFPTPKGMHLNILPERHPRKRLKNGEIGTRLSFNSPGLDFSLAALYTWDKIPYMQSYVHNDSLLIQPTFHRMGFIGGDLSKPIKQTVLRFEGGYNIGKRFVPSNPTDAPQKQNTINTLIGLDWFAPNQWMLSIQFAHEQLLGAIRNLKENKRNSTLMTCNISKKLFNDFLILKNFSYIDLVNKSLFGRFNIEYALTDQICTSLGYDLFLGRKGLFGKYKDNSELWIKAKYSF